MFLDSYVQKTAKPALVMLLLDVSGSMAGDKINTLNSSLREMLKTFVSETNTLIKVAIITFGLNGAKQICDFVNSDTIEFKNLQADGGTPLGEALTLAKNIIEDTNQTPKRAYRPIVVLVSDGAPNDEWEQPLEDFIKEGRTSKTQRLALAIGSDADKDMLKMFIEGSANGRLFVAEDGDATKIVDFFKFVTQSTLTVSQKIPKKPLLNNNNENIKTETKEQKEQEKNDNKDEEPEW